MSENSKFKEWWNEKDSETQLKIKRGSYLGAGLLIILAIYYGSGEAESRGENTQEEKPQELTIGDDLLQDDIREEVSTKLKTQDQHFESMQKQVDALTSKLQHKDEMQAHLYKELERLQKRDGDSSDSSLTNLDGSKSYPPPPAYNPSTSKPGYNGYSSSNDMVSVELQEKVIGMIGHVKGLPSGGGEESTKKRRKIYLPPAMMEGMLLHGIDALVSEGASANPETVMIRVQAPAVLPNEIKAGLDGCFMIANAFGRLDKERVQVELVNLSCLSPNGSAVIDEEIMGYVTDLGDGKRDLAGIVVTKMGAHVMRASIAGAIGGIGEGIGQTGTTSQITSGGIASVVDSDRIGAAMVGGALKAGSQDTQKLFNELARQTLPIIEVGSAKKLVAHIQQGVWLEIKDRVEEDVK